MPVSTTEPNVAALAALAQATRLRIVAVVGATGGRGVAAGDIARTVRCPASTLSFHLKELVQAGVLEGRASGRFIIYALRRGTLERLASYLTELAGTAIATAAGRASPGRPRAARPKQQPDRDQLSMFGE